MPNTTLLNATLEHIRKHPESWEQETYRNGDMGCFAFHAALLAGAEVEDPDDPECDTLRFNEAARALGFGPGEYITIGDFAQKALVLTEGARCELFAAHRTLVDLEAMVTALST